MAKFLVKVPDQHVVGGHEYVIEADRMEVKDKMIQFFATYASTAPSYVFPIHCIALKNWER